MEVIRVVLYGRRLKVNDVVVVELRVCEDATAFSVGF